MNTYCQRFFTENPENAVWLEYAKDGDLIAIYKEKDKRKPEKLYNAVPLAVEICIGINEYNYWIARGKDSSNILYYEE